MTREQRRLKDQDQLASLVPQQAVILGAVGRLPPLCSPTARLDISTSFTCRNIIAKHDWKLVARHEILSCPSRQCFTAMIARLAVCSLYVFYVPVLQLLGNPIDEEAQQGSRLNVGL